MGLFEAPAKGGRDGFAGDFGTAAETCLLVTPRLPGVGVKEDGVVPMGVGGGVG